MKDLERKIGSVLSELENAFFDIPFENSDFQNLNFVLGSQITPARAYRAIGLRMFSKIQAVKEALFGMQLKDIDIEENEDKASNPDVSSFDKRRLEIENKKIRESRKWVEKLLNDAIQELDCLYSEFKKYPRYTREQFEAEEFTHFDLKMKQQLEVSGAGESLTNMHKNFQELEMLLKNPEYLSDMTRFHAALDKP